MSIAYSVSEAQGSRPPTVGQEQPPRTDELKLTTTPPSKLRSAGTNTDWKHDHPTRLTEAQASGACLRWAHSLDTLLQDSEGVRIFERFLHSEGHGNALEFYFACHGARKSQLPPQKLQSLVRQIYRRFVRPDTGVLLTERTRHVLHERVCRKDFSKPDVLDAALFETECLLRNELYPCFIRSDLFIQHVQAGIDDSSGSDDSISSLNRSSLPEVPEEDVLKMPPPASTVVPCNTLSKKDTRHKTFVAGSAGVLKLNPAALQKTLKSRSRLTTDTGYPSGAGGRPLNPYHVHVSYAPVSKQESELASLSSDALTESDSLDVAESSQPLKQPSRRLIRQMADKNPEVELQQLIIPRSQRPMKLRNLAETDPEQFAEILTERLNQLFKEQEVNQLVHKTLSAVSESDDTDNSEFSGREGTDGNRSRLFAPRDGRGRYDTSMLLGLTAPDTSLLSNTTLSTLADALAAGCNPAEDADSILEQHVSRVWPGFRSPRHRPSSRRTLDSSTVCDYRRHRGRDVLHSSLDSGMGVEELLQRAEALSDTALNRHDLLSVSLDTGERREKHRHGRWSSDHDRGGRRERKQSRKQADVDSGVSGMSGAAYTDGSKQLPVPNLRDPSNERIMCWMSDSDRVRSTRTHHADSDRTSSKRHSHKSSKRSSHSHDRSGTEVAGDIASFIPTEEDRLLAAITKHKERRSPLLPMNKSHAELDETIGKRKKSSPSSTSNSSASSSSSGPRIVIGYFLGDESVPYRSSLHGTNITLAQFKSHVSKKGSYRYFFKQPLSGEDVAPDGCVYDEVSKDSSNLPLFDGKVISRIMPALNSDGILGTPGDHGVRVLQLYEDETIPFRFYATKSRLTLAEFKQLLVKHGRFKCYFKSANDEFGPGGVVFEEITSDSQTIPLWNNQVVARLQKVE